MKIMQITKQGDSFVLSDSNGAVAAFGFPDLNAAINGAKIYGANIVYVVEVNDNIDDRIRYDWGMDFGNIASYCGAPTIPVAPSDTTRALIDQLISRDDAGRKKYGVTLDRTDLSLVDWLQHQTEELLDAAGYAQAAKREAERLLSAEEPLRKLIGHLQENPPRIHHPSLRALVDLL